MIITKEFINQGKNRCAGITSVQIKLLGASYPVMKGWEKKILGKEISTEDAEMYLSFKGVNAIQASKKVNYKKKQKRIQNLDMTSYSKPITVGCIYLDGLAVSATQLLDSYVRESGTPCGMKEY